MRPSPKPSGGQGLSASTQRVELGTVLLELLTLRLHDVRSCVRDELLVREHPLGAFDLLRDARALGFHVALPVRGRPHDGLEDAKRVAADLYAHAAAAIDARGRLRRSERLEIHVEPRVRLPPRPEDEP